MAWTPLELAANLMTAICIFLAGRNNVHTWWTGLVGCVLFAALFYTSQLYADVTLQLFFFVTGVIGWLNWADTKDKPSLPITQAPYATVAGMTGVAILIAALYGWILHRYTDAYAPWVDSLVLTLSVMAQLLLVRRNVQTWPAWLIVNTLSVPLFWSRELYLTSVLYGFFWINALISWRSWIKLSTKQEVV